MRYFHQLLVLSAVSSSVALDAYPAVYPFENELDPPVAPLAATPSRTYDESDEGGYAYFYNYAKVLTEEDIPFCVWNSGVFSYFSKAVQKWPAFFPDSYFNCTESSDGQVFNADTWVGKFGKYTFCEPGECCKEYYGVPARQSNSPDHFSSRHTTLKDRYEGGMCSETFPEAVYCAEVSDSFTSWCHEQYVSVLERGVVTPCFDLMYHYVFSCDLFKLTGMYDDLVEPPGYVSLSTVQQMQAVFGAGSNMADKICHPLSYYNPENGKDYKSDTDPNKSGDSASKANKFESTAILIILFSVMLLH